MLSTGKHLRYVETRKHVSLDISEVNNNKWSRIDKEDEPLLGLYLMFPKSIIISTEILIFSKSRSSVICQKNESRGLVKYRTQNNRRAPKLVNYHTGNNTFATQYQLAYFALAEK